MLSLLVAIDFRLQSPEVTSRFLFGKDSTNPMDRICHFLVEPGLRGLDFGDLRLLWACFVPVNLHEVAARRHRAVHADIFGGKPRTSVFVLLPWTHECRTRVLSLQLVG